MENKKIKPKTIDEYITSKDAKIQPFLHKLRKIMQEAIPDATEKIAWNMPSFWKAKYIIHFEAYKDHVNIYVGPEVTDLFRDDEKYKDYKFTGRGVSIGYNQDIPEELIKNMALKSLEIIENK